MFLKILNINNIFKVFLCAFLLYLYIDFWSTSFLGICVSIVLFIGLLYKSHTNLSEGILLSIVIGLLVLEFPRNILDTYEALTVSKTVNYNVITTVKIGPFTLFVYVLFYNVFLVFFKGISIKINTFLFLAILSLALIGSFSLIKTIIFDDKLYFPNLLITDVKFILFLIIGVVLGLYLKKTGNIRKLIEILELLPILIGVRCFIFLISDVFFGKMNLDLMTQPYLSLAVLCVIMIRGDWGIYQNMFLRSFLFLSMLNPSRSFFLIAILVLSIGLLYKWYNKIKFNIKLIAQISLILGGVFVSIYLFNERLFKFFLWKLNVFNAILNDDVKISGSGQVRVIELKNVLCDLLTRFDKILFGKGFGATYKFDCVSLDNVGIIDLKSYSKDQLDSGVYYTAHSFFTTIILKYGFIGVLLYLLIPVRISLFYLNKGMNYLLLVILPIILIYLYYSRIEYMLLIGILIGGLEAKRNIYV